MSGADGLDVIAPEVGAVNFRGKTYALGPLKVGAIPAFARAIKPMLGMIEKSFGSDGVSIDTIFDAIAEHGDGFVQAVSIASGIPIAELQEADGAEFMELVPVVLRVNRDFLRRRLSPALVAAMQAARPGTSGTGQTP